MKEFLTVAALTLAAILGIAVPVLFADAAWSKHVCKQRAEMMKLDSQYRVATGCMVSVGDMYVPIGAIRIINGHLVVEQGDGN